MNDPCFLRGFERLANFNPNLQRLLQRQRPLPKPLGQRLTFQTLHYEKVNIVLMANIIQRANPRMIQGRNGPSFPLKPLLQIRIGRKMVGQDLDRHGPVEPRIAGPIHLPHAARTQSGLDFIRAKSFARGKGHACA